jgi:hypothetical protein
MCGRLTNDLSETPRRVPLFDHLVDLSSPVLRPASPVLRCSRPLCSSQMTGGTRTRSKLCLNVNRVLRSSRPPEGGRPGPSGPNSVHALRFPCRSVPVPKDVLRSRGSLQGLCQCSTHELRSRTFVSNPALSRPCPKTGCAVLLRKELGLKYEAHSVYRDELCCT